MTRPHALRGVRKAVLCCRNMVLRFWHPAKQIASSPADWKANIANPYLKLTDIESMQNI